MEYQDSDPDELSSLEEEEIKIQTRKPTKKQVEDEKIKKINEERILNLAKARQARQDKLKEKREELKIKKQIEKEENYLNDKVNSEEVILPVKNNNSIIPKAKGEKIDLKKSNPKTPKIKVMNEDKEDESSEEVIIIKRKQPKQRSKTIYIEEEEEEDLKPLPKKTRAPPKAAPRKPAPKAAPKKPLYDDYDDLSDDFDDYDEELLYNYNKPIYKPNPYDNMTATQKAIFKLMNRN